MGVAFVVSWSGFAWRGRSPSAFMACIISGTSSRNRRLAGEPSFDSDQPGLMPGTATRYRCRCQSMKILKGALKNPLAFPQGLKSAFIFQTLAAQL
jgi:hypothetical protein